MSFLEVLFQGSRFLLGLEEGLISNRLVFTELRVFFLYLLEGGFDLALFLLRGGKFTLQRRNLLLPVRNGLEMYLYLALLRIDGVLVLVELGLELDFEVVDEGLILTLLTDLPRTQLQVQSLLRLQLLLYRFQLLLQFLPKTTLLVEGLS
jgi:hypothetical protein